MAIFKGAAVMGTGVGPIIFLLAFAFLRGKITSSDSTVSTRDLYSIMQLYTAPSPSFSVGKYLLSYKRAALY